MATTSHVSPRTLITASAASLATSAIITPAALATLTTGSDPDAQIHELVRLYRDADAAFHDDYEAWDAAQTRYRKSLPEPPAPLFTGDRDFALGMPEPVSYGQDRHWYGHPHIIDTLRSTPRTRQDWTEVAQVVAEDGGVDHYPGRLPYPEAQVRADEVLAAWEAWQATKEATADAVGLYEAEERKDEAREQVFAAFSALMDTPATSLAGLIAKAEAAALQSHEEDFSAYVDQFHEDNGHAPETIALAIVRDLLRLQRRA